MPVANSELRAALPAILPKPTVLTSGCLVSLAARLSDDRLIAALEQLEALALAGTLCKWSKKARRDRSSAVLQGLGYAGATPQPQPQRQHGAVALPEALQLSPDEKRALLQALDGPLYPKSTPGLSKPILLRLNEFVLQRSGRDYVQYEARAVAAGALPAVPLALLLALLPTARRCCCYAVYNAVAIAVQFMPAPDLHRRTPAGGLDCADGGACAAAEAGGGVVGGFY